MCLPVVDSYTEISHSGCVSPRMGCLENITYYNSYRCQHKLPHSGVNSLFFNAIGFPTFHLKCPVFFCIFRVGKHALYGYALCSASSETQTTRQPASSARQS